MRYAFIATLAFLFLSILLLPTVALAASPHPNVVLVITDDQGYGDLGAHGNSMIKTPHMDELYSQSARLTNFHVDPTCSPTRSALMSGRYSTRTGVWHTIMGRSLMSPDEVTMAEVFAAAGYRTGAFGKWHLGDNYPLRAQDQGFQDVFMHGGGGVGQGPDYWGNKYFDDTYFRMGVPEKVEGYCTDVWFTDALRFIEENRDRPFFAYISTNAPHGPYLVDEKYSRPYRDQGVPAAMSNFYGMITNIDENLGRLRHRLKELGLEKNTILVFMTDNGSAAGWRAPANAEGNWRGFNAGMRGGKGSEYDGGHRVPFFIHWPGGGLNTGSDVDQLSAHVDVLPTLAGLCRIKDPAAKTRDGSSLVKPLYGNQKVLRDRTLLVHSQRIPYPEKWRKSSVMTERWRLVNGKELYDMQADPGQKSNVAEDHPQVLENLRGQYDDWWQSLSVAFDDFVRIGIGSDAEPVTLLHCHDWHPTAGGNSPWHQNHVRSGFMGNGYWQLNVEQAGSYEITLRRWPAQLDQSIEATAARIQVGTVTAQDDLDGDATHASFTLDLPAGPTRLQGWLTLPGGKERGAYFVSIRRL
jgi:arylsulfatase A-like enzyme